MQRGIIFDAKICHGLFTFRVLAAASGIRIEQHTSHINSRLDYQEKPRS